MATARKLPSGNYRCRAYVGKDDNGANIYKSFTASTKAKAEKDAAEYVTRNVTVRSHGEFTFAMNKYMDSVITLSPNTIRGYDTLRRMMIENYNWFCKMDTDRIRKEDLQEVINALSISHAPKTVRNYAAFIHSVIEFSGSDAPEVDLPEFVSYFVSYSM